MRKPTLMELLTLRAELKTPQAWASALSNGVAARSALPGAPCTQESCEATAQGPPSAELLAAVEAVLPLLPDYSAVSAQIEALLGYCEAANPVETDHVARRWVLRTPTSVSFRRWLLEWVERSHLTRICSTRDLETKLRWRHALFVAAAKESERTLKRTLLRFLEILENSLEASPSSKNDSVVDKMATVALQPLETVQALLDFLWLHAEELAPSAALCAAKLHGLVLKTRKNGPEHLLEAEEVLVRLRWSLQLKPLLFRTLLEHCAAQMVFPGRNTWIRLQMGEELGGFVEAVGLSTRERIQDEMTATRTRLEQAYTAGVEHVHRPQQSGSRASCFFADGSVADYLGKLLVEQKKLLLGDLEIDLDEAPSHMFPHIFQFLGVFMNALLPSRENRDEEVLALATQNVFDTFERRSHDGRSCLDIVSLLLDLPLTSHRLWETRPELFLRVAESLCECMALHPDGKTQWAARMALQQLLFECSDAVLRVNSAVLSTFLPRSLQRRLDIRLGLCA